MNTLLAAMLPLVVAVNIAPGKPLEHVRKTSGKHLSGWCDMAAHIARMQPVALAQDPLFRRPTPKGKERLLAVRALSDAAKTPHNRKLVRRQLRALFAGAQGPVLARLSLQDRSPIFRAVALQEAVDLARKHPRLASFAGGDVSHTDPKLAAAAVRVLLNSRCDTAANYALDGLLHTSAMVRKTVVQEVFAAAEETTDIGLVKRLLKHMMESEKDAHIKAATVRRVGQMGWLPAAAQLASLATSKTAGVLTRCEALVAAARVTSQTDRATAKLWVKAADPWRRLCGVRMIAAGLTRTPQAAATLLRPLLSDKRVANDPLKGSKHWRLDNAARKALNLIELR